MGELAIKGGEPVRKKPFRSWPVVGEEERRILLEVLESGKWWYGEKVREFEEKFARFQDARFGVTTTSGTTALEVALLSLGIGAGDEVIIPSYSFVATASAVLRVNAIPIFADVEEDTLNLSIDDLKDKISEKTRAIIPVHFAGLPCDMDALLDIAERYQLFIVEDACHAWGSKWRGKGVGALGNCGVFSFQMSKNITSGEGGIILTNDPALAETMRSYINCGRGKDSPWYEHYLLGSNLRLTEIQAGLLLAQFTRLEEHTHRRERNARILDETFGEMEGIKVIRRDERVTRRAYHIYVFLFEEEKWGVDRDTFIEALRAEGIPCHGGYPHPLYRNPLFQRKGKGPRYCPLSCPFYGKDIDYSSCVTPVAEKVCKRAVWIKHPLLLGEEEDMRDIIRAVEKVWENRKELSGLSLI